MESDREDLVHRVLVGPTGGKISVWDHNGAFFPGFSYKPRRYEDYKTIKARDNDVFICTYPRSGLHWTWEITRMLKLGKTNMIDNMIMEQTMIEFNELDAVEKMESPRVFPTHMIFSQLPPSFKDKKLPLNGWFEMQKNWEKTVEENPDYPIYLLNFENLKQDTLGEIQKIAKFLEVDVSDEFCSSVASCVDFNRMKKAKEAAGEDTFISEWFEDKQYNMLRKGKIDDWKNVFTVAQHEQFLETFNRIMKDSTYKLRS